MLVVLVFVSVVSAFPSIAKKYVLWLIGDFELLLGVCVRVNGVCVRVSGVCVSTGVQSVSCLLSHPVCAVDTQSAKPPDSMFLLLFFHKIIAIFQKL